MPEVSWSAQGVRWQRSYDRVGVESFLVEAAAERSRLVGEIESCRHRTAMAEAIAAASSHEAQVRIGVLVVEAHRELLDARRDNDRAVSAVLERAEVEASRILVRAREEASELRGAGGSSPTVASASGTPKS